MNAPSASIEAIAITVSAPDFCDVQNAAAARRVYQLAAQGYTNGTIADLTGWQICDVRRALGEIPE